MELHTGTDEQLARVVAAIRRDVFERELHLAPDRELAVVHGTAR
jgi:hypothetical protein